MMKVAANTAPRLDLAIPIEVEACKAAIEAIKAAGINENDPDFAELLSSETGFDTLIERIVIASKKKAARAEGLRKLASECVHDAARLEISADKLRDTALRAMQEAGRNKVEGSYTIAVRYGKPQLIGADDPNKLPFEFRKIEVSVRKGDLRKALEEGRTIDGVTIGNFRPPFLHVS